MKASSHVTRSRETGSIDLMIVSPEMIEQNVENVTKQATGRGFMADANDINCHCSRQSDRKDQETDTNVMEGQENRPLPLAAAEAPSCPSTLL